MLPSLHVKLGIVKQFIKALDTHGDAFQIFESCFPRLSKAKRDEGELLGFKSVQMSCILFIYYHTAGVLTGPQIRNLFKCQEFERALLPEEIRAWKCIKDVCHNFLGAQRASNYHELVERMISALRDINCSMSLKVHLLHSHVDAFPIMPNESNDEQGERFHQDISYAEQRYKGKSKLRMLSDFCWNLIRTRTDSARKMPFFTK